MGPSRQADLGPAPLDEFDLLMSSAKARTD